MLDALELHFPRFNGGMMAPSGSYLHPRTMSVYWQASPGLLPLDGVFLFVAETENKQLSEVLAIKLNELLGTSYQEHDFNAYVHPHPHMPASTQEATFPDPEGLPTTVSEDQQKPATTTSDRGSQIVTARGSNRYTAKKDEYVKKNSIA